MRSRTWKILLTVFVAIGPLASMASVAAAGPDKERPFQVTSVSEFELAGTCASGAPRTVIYGEGVATHLGRLKISREECADADTGEVTWTAANGDEIHIEFTSVIDLSTFQIELYCEEVTGTVRFENVELSGEPLAGTIAFYDPLGTSGHIEAGLDDVIIFDGSDRSD